jgi:uncharacterized protein
MRRIASRALTGLLCLTFFVPIAFTQDLPRPTDYVNDYAGVVSAEDERAMRRVIEAVHKETRAEIAVAVVDSIEPYATIDAYGIALAEAWGVGPADTDAGVILIVAVAERRVRIEVGGGLEGAITDGRAGEILDDFVVPYLRENNWGEGLKAGVGALAAEIAEEYGVDLESLGVAAQQPVSRSRSSSGTDIGDIVYFIIVFFFMITGRFFWPLLFVRRRRGFFGGGFGSFGSGGSKGFSGFGGGGFSGGGASRGF